MSTFLDHAYSLVHQDNAADQPTLQELRTQLEKGTDDTKVETMKRILTIMLNGDSMPLLLMHIIRFVMPSKSKQLKKLLYFYYEICPKLDAAGKLKQEMILVWYVVAQDRESKEDLAKLSLQQWDTQRPTTPERIHPRQHPSIPLQASRTRIDRTSPLVGAVMPRASSCLRAKECRLCRVLHLPIIRVAHPRCPRTHPVLFRNRKRSYLQTQRFCRPYSNSPSKGVGIPEHCI